MDFLKPTFGKLGSAAVALGLVSVVVEADNADAKSVHCAKQEAHLEQGLRENFAATVEQFRNNGGTTTSVYSKHMSYHQFYAAADRFSTSVLGLEPAANRVFFVTPKTQADLPHDLPWAPNSVTCRFAFDVEETDEGLKLSDDQSLRF